MKLKTEIIEAIAASRELQLKISLLTEAHPNTISYWVIKNGHRSPLIAYNVLQLISHELKIPINDLVDDDTPYIPTTI